MIHPSYVDLMKVVNKDIEEGETPVINSRYSIVMATAKRARQLVDGDEPLVYANPGRKPLSIAVEELEQDKVRILPQDEAEVEAMEINDYTAAISLEETIFAGNISGYDEDEEIDSEDESSEDADENDLYERDADEE